MKILYATDLHGSMWKYEYLFMVAVDLQVDMAINGGDMLPKHGDLRRQGDFIRGFLDRHFSRYDEAAILHLGLLGNDDLRIFDDLFREVCDDHSFTFDLAQQMLRLQGLTFVGMNRIADCPFRLKDRCRKDRRDYVFQEQLGSALLSDPGGWIDVEDWPAYAETLPTIEEELAHLERPADPAKTVYVIHMPPCGLGLDVCVGGRQVGSKAVYEFLKKAQPRLSLHGHIHESPEVSGTWKALLGNTVCVQPGQLEDFTYVLADLDSMQIDRTRVNK